MMENVYENVSFPKRELSNEVVKEALSSMLDRLRNGEAAARVNSAKEEAGNDMVLHMRLVFPLIVDVQVQTVAQLGLPSNKDGVRDFLIRVHQLMQEDDEIMTLFMQLKQIHLPSSL